MEDNVGRGWGFPPRFNTQIQGVEMTRTDKEEIEQSLAILFSTQQNERLFHNEYGCNLDKFQFATFDEMMVMRLKKLLKEVICEYEPRIELDNVEVNTSDAVDGRLYIKVNYIIVATGKEATWENTINLQM